MSRKIIKFYKLDPTEFNSQKIETLKNQYGGIVYGIFAMLLIEIIQNNDNRLNKNSIDDFAKKYKFKPNLVKIVANELLHTRADSVFYTYKPISILKTQLIDKYRVTKSKINQTILSDYLKLEKCTKWVWAVKTINID